MSFVNKTIMVVDDEEIIRNSFIDFFEDHLWTTLQAESGECALEMLETHQPDAFIVDVRMGGMDGNTFIRSAYKKTDASVFIICTGSPEYELPEDLKKLPRVYVHLFKKPVQDLILLETAILNFIKEND